MDAPHGFMPSALVFVDVSSCGPVHHQTEHRLPVYYSPLQDQQALGTDVLAQVSSNLVTYASFTTTDLSCDQQAPKVVTPAVDPDRSFVASAGVVPELPELCIDLPSQSQEPSHVEEASQASSSRQVSRQGAPPILLRLFSC